MKQFVSLVDQTKWSISMVERPIGWVPIESQREGESVELGEWLVRTTSSPQEVVVSDGETERRAVIAKVGDVWWVNIGGKTSRINVVEKGVANAFDASGSLTSPMPGKVLTVMCAVGESVTEGQPLLVLEAMKMEHRICAPAAGVVSSIHYEAGSQVDQGAVLLAIDSESGD